MYYSTNTDSFSPTANIAVNRNRLKSYDDKVYLKNGTHFEIELFNPKSISVLAKIYLDGKAISSTGIIIKPGQRVFLERWIDEPKKFLFETYEVEGSTEAKIAIKENGKVFVEFYDGHQITSLSSFSYPSINTASITTDNGGTWTTSPSTIYCGPSLHTNYSMNIIIGSANTKTSSNLAIPASIETGRSEKGEPSHQKFSQSNDSFNSWISTSVNIQILPESRKPVEVKEIRNYCCECGTRIKKSNWKFCPNCGTKI
jgi:hypothetical protein